MSDEKKGQDARAKFYNTDSVIRYLKTVGIPKRTGEFKEMVASGSKVMELKMVASAGVPNGAEFSAHDLAANADRVFLPEQVLDFNS